MRLPMFLAVAAAAVVTFVAPAQQLYDSPTFSQVERLIGAVQEAGGDPSAYTAAVARAANSLYGRPTFDQMERLIAEVRTNGVSGAGSVSPEDVAAITGIHIGESTVKTQYVKGVWTTGAAVEADKTVEIGFNAHAMETNASNQSIAIGRDALSAGSATVAVGPNSFAEGAQSAAVGWRANAVGDHSVSIGSAKKSGENYYKDGVVNPDSDLQLASGAYSVAIGFNDKATGNSSMAIGKNASATAEGSAQLGTGTNAAPHTLKFEDVTIVKDGRVVGSAPDPQVVPSVPGVASESVVSVSPGSMTTVLPDDPLDGGSEMYVECSGMRNYTLYLPNEPTVREGLPVNFGFELPEGTRHAVNGPAVVTRLPCRIVSEQPYGGLAVINATELDDGYDWTPVVTNCCIAYTAGGRFVCTNSTWSVQGMSLHCATGFTLSYPLQPPEGEDTPTSTNTVDLLVTPAGQSFIPGTLYGSAPPLDYTVPAGEEPAASSGSFPAVLRYTTAHGTAEFAVTLDVIGE